MNFRLGLLTLCLTGVSTTMVHASEPLALDHGCFTCHGPTPQKHAPSFQELAAHYAKFQGQPNTDQELADRLRHPYLFGGIKAHERLSEETALTLVRWLIDGAP